jgi:hypothetical protein
MTLQAIALVFTTLSRRSSDPENLRWQGPSCSRGSSPVGLLWHTSDTFLVARFDGVLRRPLFRPVFIGFGIRVAPERRFDAGLTSV